MTERTTVQAPLIRYADQAGWEPVRSDVAFAFRGGEEGRFFANCPPPPQPRCCQRRARPQDHPPL
jgi:hypothetical protein